MLNTDNAKIIKSEFVRPVLIQNTMMGTRGKGNTLICTISRYNS